MVKIFSGTDSGMSRLKIESFESIDCTGTAKETFYAQSNPEKLSYTFKIDTGDDEVNSAEGNSAAPPVFKGYTETVLEFDLVADATGIVPIPPEVDKKFFGTDDAPSIRKYLDSLHKTVYAYQEKTHGPPYLTLTWGKIFPSSSTKGEDSPPAVYKGMIESYTVDIVLFSLTGEPIKANIKLSIKSLIAPDAKPLGQSPDLTHHIPIQYGDKMSKHCNDIYGRYDTRICSAVAKYNNMVDWELQSKIGETLTFPSIHMLNELYIKKWEEIGEKDKKKEMSYVQTHYDYMKRLIGDKKAKQYFKTFNYNPNQPFKEWKEAQQKTKGYA